MESETSPNMLQAQLKLARRSIVHYSNRLKKKRKRKSTGCGPSPAALLLKAALDQPTLDHVIIPVSNQSDESSEEEQSTLMPELKSALKEIQTCQKLIDEQLVRIFANKDGSPMERLALLQISISALQDSAKKFVNLAEQQVEKAENPQKSTDSSSVVSQFSDDNLEEFYDALDTNLSLNMPDIYRTHEQDKTGLEEKMVRRTQVPFRPSNTINYLAFLRNCLSQSKGDLSKIGMPFLFFALTSYSTCDRTNKPFNPLLSETYECDRRSDRGFISIAEQVSHHPPVSALHARSKKWTLQQAYTPTTKIKGRSLYLNPVGGTYICFNDSPDVFVYGKVCTVNTMTNLVSGKLHTENIGELTVTNNSTRSKCIMKFHEQGYFSRETPRKVSGTVMDSNETAHFEIEAIWNRHAILHCVETQTSKMCWRVDSLPKDADKMHNFSSFAIQLNEPESGLPPTDSRLRIDQRLMEDGKWAEANTTKQKLEQAQRKRRSERETKGIEYKPIWFQTKDPAERIDEHDIFVFNERYLSCKQNNNWSECPRIFDIS
ncbi:Oxysterol-binding protein [Aphelenchoides bicaudatus]|nr:Oxysterol-binding protein [Aphelenchoides bicaudatus]